MWKVKDTFGDFQEYGKLGPNLSRGNIMGLKIREKVRPYDYYTK
jgi:hypothetical protein